VEIEKKPAGSTYTRCQLNKENISMGRLTHLKIRVDSLTEAWLAARARRTGTSLSEYVRGLIAHDLSRTADGNADAPPAVNSTRHRISDTLAAQLLELSLLTPILVRAQLSRAVGEEDARRIETRAKQKAAEQLRMLLGDPGADSELEPVSPLK
jgi:hypothetical protein